MIGDTYIIYHIYIIYNVGPPFTIAKLLQITPVPITMVYDT